MSMAVVRYAADEVPYGRSYMMLELLTRNIPRKLAG